MFLKKWKDLYEELNFDYQKELEEKKEISDLKNYYKEKCIELERKIQEQNYREEVWQKDRIQLNNIISNLLIIKNELNIQLLEIKKNKKSRGNK